MSMSQRPLSDDLLLTIIEIVTLLKSDSAPDKLQGYSLLDGLLWGTYSFSEVPEEANHCLEGQITNLLNIFKGNPELGQLKCRISLTKADIDFLNQYWKTSDDFILKAPKKENFKDQVKDEQKRRKIFIDQFQKSDSIVCAYSDLYSMEFAILHARNNKWQRIQSMPDGSEREVAEGTFYLENPIDLQLFAQREQLLPFIASYLEEYLSKFAKDEIAWGQNIIKIELQKELVLDLLKNMERKYGASFRVSSRDFSEHQGLRPLETLLILQSNGLISNMTVSSHWPDGEIEILIAVNSALSNADSHNVTSRLRIYEPLRPETLLLIKCMLLAEKSDHFWEAKEYFLDLSGDSLDMLSDHELYSDDIAKLMEELITTRIFFDSQGDRSKLEEKPVMYEFLLLCLSEKIPTQLTFRSSRWHKVNISNSINAFLEQDKDQGRRERNKKKMKELTEINQQKILVSIQEASELILFNNGNPKVIWSDKYKDFNNLFGIRPLFELELIHQKKEFFDGLRRILDNYLQVIISSNISFEEVMPWGDQLEIVRSELRLASTGNNSFTIDDRNFARRSGLIGTGIPSNLKPVECLFIMELQGEILIKEMKLDDFDSDDHIAIDLAYTLKRPILSPLSHREIEISPTEDRKMISFTDDGDLRIGNEIVVSIAPSTRGFWFFMCLFENIGNLVPYDKLYKYIIAKQRKSLAGKTPQSFCQTLKSELRRDFLKKPHQFDIDQLVKVHSNKEGKKGYKMLQEISKK